MAARIEPLQEGQIEELAGFTRGGFCREGDYCDFARPEVLRWEFFQKRGPWKIPRSLIVSEGGRIAAHVGLFTTSFCSPELAVEAPAVHMVNWLTTNEASSFGALLMLRAFSLAPVTYALGCTPAAARVLERAGFELVLRAPLFHRVLHRARPAVWRELHGRQPVVRAATYAAVDLLQSLRPAGTAQNLKFRPVASFGPEIDEVLTGAQQLNAAWTSRSPEVLNHYLSFPLGNFRGFLFESDRICGFGMLSIISKPRLRIARVVDCLLDSPDTAMWADGIALLHGEAAKEGADLISCYATTPWMTDALTRNGFFRRGKTPFYLRDPKKLVPRSRPFHLTHLEADLSFI